MKSQKTVEEFDLMTKDAYLQSAMRDQKIGKNSNRLYCLVEKKKVGEN